MSRIGRHPIAIPAGVTVTVSDDNHVVVKGPKGQLEQLTAVLLPLHVLTTKRKTVHFTVLQEHLSTT